MENPIQIVSLGEILIDMFPVEVGRKLADVSAFYPKPGGACANVAVGVSRLGKRSAFIGKVGDDPFGFSLISILKENGVETRGMKVDDRVRTSLAFIAMPDENSAEFIFYRNPGADLCLRSDELDPTLFETAKAFHCGSLSLVEEPARTAQYAAVEHARNAGAFISFDVNHRPRLWENESTAIAQIRKMIGLTDLLKVNEIELKLLTGTQDPVAGGNELLKSGVKLVAITLGTKGSYFFAAGCHGHVPPFIAPTIDAIGCGDAFVAGLLSALTSRSGSRLDPGESFLRSCFTYANACGALTSTKRGVIPALPTAQEVQEFMNEQTNQ
jgi:fructokinase